MNALDLNDVPFQRRPSLSRTFSKCVRKGKDLELSGSDPYNSLLLPLAKSLQHALSASIPVETAWYFDANLMVALAVLDAPMLLVSQIEGQSKVRTCPWVRVVRHEYLDRPQKYDRDEMWVIDVVHKDFFSEYLVRELIPFGRLFAQRVLRHPTELATGSGFVPGMGQDSWRQIESRMQAASVSSLGKRVAAVAKRRPKKD